MKSHCTRLASPAEAPSSRAVVGLPTPLRVSSTPDDLGDVECLNCVRDNGLCDRHSRTVLPQLAVNLGWLRLMGEPLVEQRKRQVKPVKVTAPLPVSEQGEAWRQRRKSAQSIARSKRRGYFGLARAIAESK